MKKTQPDDLLFILKILKKKKIQYFDKRIPFILLCLIYHFLWNIFYSAKILTNFRGTTSTKKKDISLACIFFAKKIEKKTDKIFKKDFFKNIENSNFLRDTNKPKKNRTFNKKISVKTNNLRIV